MACWVTVWLPAGEKISDKQTARLVILRVPMPWFLPLSLASRNFVTRGKYRMVCDSRDQIKWECLGRGMWKWGWMPKQAVVWRRETDDCGRQIEALKNGRSKGSCPMEMCHEVSSINILIKASQALESIREQTAFSSHIEAQSCCCCCMSRREQLSSASIAL